MFIHQALWESQEIFFLLRIKALNALLNYPDLRLLEKVWRGAREGQTQLQVRMTLGKEGPSSVSHLLTSVLAVVTQETVSVFSSCWLVPLWFSWCVYNLNSMIFLLVWISARGCWWFCDHCFINCLSVHLLAFVLLCRYCGRYTL